MVQVLDIIACVRAAGSASKAGWDRSLGAEDGNYPWVWRTGPGPWVQKHRALGSSGFCFPCK